MDLTAKRKKNVLLISAFFAPSSIVGAKRFTFLARLFEDKGLNIHVLTLKQGPGCSVDDTLPVSGIVHSAGLVLPYPIKRIGIANKLYMRLVESIFYLFDPYMGWLLPGVRKGWQTIRRHKIDLIIATAPPNSSLVIGAILSRLTKIPLIVDYRDPWTADKLTSYFRGKVKRRANVWLERWVIKQASTFVFATDIMYRNFEEMLGKHTRAPLYVITNGFNPTPQITPLSLGQNKKNILYAGNFYGQRKLWLLIEPLLKLIDDGYITKQDVEIHVFGYIPQSDWDKIVANDLVDMVKQHQPVSYSTILGYMKGADILFLPSGEDVTYALPFKIFDYLSVERPIFAIAPERSAVAELIRELGCGELGIINNRDSIYQSLLALLVSNKTYSFINAKDYMWEKVAERYLKAINERLKE